MFGLNNVIDINGMCCTHDDFLEKNVLGDQKLRHFIYSFLMVF